MARQNEHRDGGGGGGGGKGAAVAEKDPIMHLAAGGIAGTFESACCHPLDTIKTRVQLSGAGAGTRSHGAMATTTRIVNNEGFFALYKGLSAVMAGIVPKMAVRFWSFEMYKGWLGASDGDDKEAVFMAGLGSGVTEAVLVVTPAELCKIRMQADLTPTPVLSAASHNHGVTAATAGGGGSKYPNVLQTAFLVAREEGVGALYKGLAPTVLRQGCNQAINFTCYELFKERLSAYLERDSLAPWHHMMLGGLSGGIGPWINNPLDVVKTRIQKQVTVSGQAPKYEGSLSGMALIARQEGVLALWRGMAPRLLRIMPGQAITFMTYEWVSKRLPVTLSLSRISSSPSASSS